MTITLTPITADNWHEAIELSVEKAQADYVAHNLYSIAEAQFDPFATNLAIYAGETMVGFLMYSEDEEIAGDYWINRLMVAKEHQRNGYGTAAMQEIIKLIKVKHNGNAISITYVPGNEMAADLYARLGFAKTGEIDEGEIVMRLKE